MNYTMNNVGYPLGDQNLGLASYLATDVASSEFVSQAINTANVDSILVVVPIVATLASDNTIATVITYQESADNSSWDTAVAYKTLATVLTGIAAGTEQYATDRVELDTMGKKKYVRVNVTPDFSALGTDTAILGAVVVYPKKYNDV